MLNAYRPILQKLVDAGHEAYFVGGCVRDHLLGRESKDVDICTSAYSDEVAALFPDSKKVGAAFGVVLVTHEGVQSEVATFRIDGNYSDGRHPDTVEFTRDLRQDLARRDFTINAMAMGLDGKIVDPFGGQAHLLLRLICCAGSPRDRFREDALRMLRAIRFSAQLGFRISFSTKGEIQTNSALLQNVSTERAQTELSKILVSGDAEGGILDLFAAGLDRYLFPTIRVLFDCEQNPKYHPEGNVGVHTLGLLRQLPKDCSLTLALSALLHDIGKPATKQMKDGQPTFHGHEEVGAKMAEMILRRLKYPVEVIDRVVSNVAQHMAFRNVKVMRRAKLYRFLRQFKFDELLELHRMDALAGSGNLEHYEFCVQMLKEIPPEVLKPKPLVTGFDLIQAGYKPGPIFKEILEQVETWQLENGTHSFGYAMRQIETIYGYMKETV